MAQALQIFKVATLPGTGVAHAIYMTPGPGGNEAEIFVTDASGNYRNLGNEAFVNDRIQTAITNALAAQETMQVYADIAARDADQANLDRNVMVVVKDASADPDVGAGAAIYVYEDGPDTFTRLAEVESMDVVLSWANITGKPTSSPAQIDDAVTKRHSHANKVALDRLGLDNDGSLTVDGSAMLPVWAATPAW